MPKRLRVQIARARKPSTLADWADIAASLSHLDITKERESDCKCLSKPSGLGTWRRICGRRFACGYEKRTLSSSATCSPAGAPTDASCGLVDAALDSLGASEHSGSCSDAIAERTHLITITPMPNRKGFADNSAAYIKMLLQHGREQVRLMSAPLMPCRRSAIAPAFRAPLRRHLHVFAQELRSPSYCRKRPPPIDFCPAWKVNPSPVCSAEWIVVLP